jgi:hypothetical protein
VKKDVPLFTEKKNLGRPVKYDFSAFKNPSVKYIVFSGLTIKNYDSIRSTFCRWRRIENVIGRFEYDFLDETEKEECAIAIWRSGEF